MFQKNAEDRQKFEAPEGQQNVCSHLNFDIKIKIYYKENRFFGDNSEIFRSLNNERNIARGTKDPGY